MTTTTSTGPDVVVRRCSVEVVRRGGWSWGPDPDALVRRVLDALPALLSRELAGLPDDDHVEITEPVVLDVRVRLSELLAGDVGRASLRSQRAGPRRPSGCVTRCPGPHLRRTGTARPGTARSRHRRRPGVGAGPAAGFVAELAARQELAALIELLPEPSRAGLADCGRGDRRAG